MTNRAPSPTLTRPVPPPSAPRPRRRRHWLRLALVAALLVVVGAVAWVVWFSSVLAVQDVRVLGVDGGRADLVLRTAAVPVGVPLARLDTADAQQRVGALPWVASVEVRRGWPREVVVAVTPRVPIAVLADGGAAGRQAVDADGVAFEVTGGLPKDLPRVDAEGVGRETAMAVLSTLPADVARRVVAVSASTRDDVELLLRSGDLVQWGSAERAEFKAEVLRALLKRKADVYDVSAPELPTTFRSRS